MSAEEKIILAQAEKVLHGAPNPAIIGENGEKSIRQLLTKYLPTCFRLSSGHVMHPSGQKSPQADILILDSRFPPLAVHEDDTTLEMRESVLGIVSVKKRLDRRTIGEQDAYARRMILFFDARRRKADIGDLPIHYVLCYHSAISETTVLSHLTSVTGLRNPLFTIFCMSMPKKAIPRRRGHGAIFRYDAGTSGETTLCSIRSTSPFSDCYYMLLDDGYFMLGRRQLGFEDIRLLIMPYYSWGRKM